MPARGLDKEGALAYLNEMNQKPPTGPARARPIRIGVSACLLGQPVRYDGGHKHDRWVTGELGRYVEFVPVCPEVEAGFGVPREAMRLVGDPESPRLVTIATGQDKTSAMRDWAKRRVEELAGENLCGFIFKSRSPSSGMARVKVYPEKGGMPAHAGVGLFARAFMERFPLLPVEEEGRLNDARLRENFIERIFALRDWRDALEACGAPGGLNAAPLVAFQTRRKLQLMAHAPDLAREMGRLVAGAKGADQGALLGGYEKLLLTAMSRIATVAKNVNVLQHMAGYFKKILDRDDRREIEEVIANYRAGLTPLIVPVTLFNHHVRKHGVAYLAEQTYLHPHPLELKLRNYY